MKQLNIPHIGKFYQQFTGAGLYFTAGNLAVSSVILWQTTIAGWASRNLSWLSFPVYLLLCVLVILAVMNAHWFLVERSRNAIAAQQAYIPESPSVKDLVIIKSDLAKIKAALGVKE